MFIFLRCQCGNAAVDVRRAGDPPEAVELVTNICDICDPGGGFDEALYYDRDGRLCQL